MKQSLHFALTLMFIVSLSVGSALAVNAAVVRVLEEQAAQYETKIDVAVAEARAAASSRDLEIERLNARVDEQWREFYETLEARQPVLRKGKERKGKGGYGTVYVPKD